MNCLCAPFPSVTLPRCCSSELGGFCCYCLGLLVFGGGGVGREPSAESASCGLKPVSFRATQISLFWHKHPATEREGKESSDRM